MKKLIIFIALPLSFANAEPTFRYDERKDPNREAVATKEVTPPPARPAYYDAYKKTARDPSADHTMPSAHPMGPSSASSSQVTPPPIPAGATTEMQQQIHQQLQNVDPAALQKAQEQLQKSYLSPPPTQ